MPHGLMTRTYVSGMSGDVGRALAATAEFVDEMEQLGDLGARYVPAATNFRAWVLRNLGREAEAAELNQRARGLAGAVGMEEPFNQGTLDLVDGRLLAGDPDGAVRLLAEIRPVDQDAGVMLWHQHERRRLLEARLALATDRAEEAVTLATEVVATAAQRGSRRHAVLAEVVQVLARVAGGEAVARDRVEDVLSRLIPLAGLEAWRWSAELARGDGVGPAAEVARRQADRFVGSAPSDERDAVQHWVERWLVAR